MVPGGALFCEQDSPVLRGMSGGPDLGRWHPSPGPPCLPHRSALSRVLQHIQSVGVPGPDPQRPAESAASTARERTALVKAGAGESQPQSALKEQQPNHDHPSRARGARRGAAHQRGVHGRLCLGWATSLELEHVCFPFSSSIRVLFIFLFFYVLHVSFEKGQNV